MNNVYDVMDESLNLLGGDMVCKVTRRSGEVGAVISQTMVNSRGPSWRERAVRW